MGNYTYSMILQEVAKTGMSFASFAHEVKRNSSTIGQWASGWVKKPPVNVKPILARRGKFLSRISLKRYDFDWVCAEFGIKKAHIAKQLGISKQALDDCRKRGFSDERQKDIEQVFHSIGRRLQTLAERM